MSLWPVNSALFVPTISSTTLSLSFANLSLGLRPLKHVKAQNLTRQFYRQAICLSSTWPSIRVCSLLFHGLNLLYQTSQSNLFKDNVYILEVPYPRGGGRRGSAGVEEAGPGSAMEGGGGGGAGQPWADRRSRLRARAVPSRRSVAVSQRE